MPWIMLWHARFSFPALSPMRLKRSFPAPDVAAFDSPQAKSDVVESDIDSDSGSDVLPAHHLILGLADEVLGFDSPSLSVVGNSSDIEDIASDSDESMGESDNDSVSSASLPALDGLRSELLDGYTLSPCPDSEFHVRSLTKSEMLSLQHYIAWSKSNGTVLAYKLHAQVLQSTSNEDILSLYSVRKLAAIIADLQPQQVDICPASCIAFTGKYKHMETCPSIRDSKVCGQARYRTNRRKPVARAQMVIFSIMATIKAMFANVETSQLLRYRDKCLQKALHVVATAATQTFSDFGDSEVQMDLYQSRSLFEDPRDIALALSTDGAQLTMKKQSDSWLLILILLNLPPEIRYQSNSTIIALSTPGPKPPHDIESFIYPIFEQMAMASEGIWTWDAVDSSYFVNRAYVTMILGDMLGSAKLNGMAGHMAVYGDRFTTVRGARSSLAKGAKAQYYPIHPPNNEQYNPDRPFYDLNNLPMRQEDTYWKILAELEQATTKAKRNEITRRTGISKMPLCAAGKAFKHPSSFPLDPFHLFYENQMAHIWDLWTSGSSPLEIIHMSSETATLFGQEISKAMLTLPSCFCGPVRDPHLKRQSQYKIYEWMALLHWYILPIGIELELNPSVLENFSFFVQIVEFSMTIKPRTRLEIEELHNLIKEFLCGFERIYVGDDPKKISRMRLCIFQLIHVPQHILWNGSIRLGSQATVERAIGEMGHKIRSKKEPFANLANIIYEKEVVKVLLLYYPTLYPNSQSVTESRSKVFQPIVILQREQKEGQEFMQHLLALNEYLGVDHGADNFVRYGKFRLSNGRTLRSELSESRMKSLTRLASFFEVNTLLYQLA